MILHNGGNVCAYVSFHNLPIYAHKTPREEKGEKSNEEQHWRRICPVTFFFFLIDTTQLSLNNKRSSIFPQQQEEENACYKIQNAYEQ